MEGVLNKTVNNKKLCILCNEVKTAEECKPATDQNFATFQESAKSRKLAIDLYYGDFLDEYLKLSINNVQYHKKCYSNFTNKTLISRLQRRNLSVDGEPEQPDISEFTNQTLISLLHECNSSAGGASTPTDWSLCLICQRHKNDKDHLRNVSENTALQIETFAEVDNLLFVRIRDINLVAARVKFHGLCLIDLERRYKKKVTSHPKKSSALKDLCTALRSSTDGKVI